MSAWKKTLLAFVCTSALLFTACNDDNDHHVVDGYDTYLSETIYSHDRLIAASSIKMMKYTMPSVAGKDITASALVFTPRTPRPKDGWRVVVWAHGTVGSGDQCAPSRNALNPRFKVLAESLLAAGYVIVAPDYEGLGEKGIHPYLNLQSAAQSVIYAQKAYQERYAVQSQGTWMSVGQSQGGHASLATAEFAQNDANYLGAVAAAPASSLGYIIKYIAPKLLEEALLAESLGLIEKGTAAVGYADLLAFSAYATTGIRAYAPDFDYNVLFEPRSQPIVDAAFGTTGDNGLCIIPELETRFTQDILQYVEENPGKTILDYPGLVKDFDQHPAVVEFLVKNQPATKYIAKPIMIVQGKLDAAVPYTVTEQLAADLEAKGTEVEWHLVEGATHTQAIVMKNKEVVEFIQAHMPAR
jgi:predicted esterase